MKNKMGRHRPARAASEISRPRAPAEAEINVGPALDCSPVTSLFGRPYPVQFRAQGATEAWTRALENTELWRCWQDPGTQCWQIRQDILRQLECRHPLSPQFSRLIAEDRQRLAVEVSTNLKYHLSQGTVIEATPALETLLANSDVDLSLPMSMVAPPYRAQYLHFGEAAMRYVGVPASQAADHYFDGAFCFLSRQAMSGALAGNCWTLELVFISKREDSYGGHVSLLGNTDRGDITVGEWLTRVLGAVSESRENDIHRSMHVAVSYVVRLFLYMALKQARVTPHREYDEALCRAAGLGERKRVKLMRRSAALYNRILVGPESLPPSAASGAAGTGVAPHWRRGHFRMQPCGTGNQQRKLIFVAPVLIHAEQLQGDLPAPKSYRAGASALALT